jgi:hypothetical protein
MYRTRTLYQTLTSFKIWAAQKNFDKIFLAVASIVRQVLQIERHFDLGRGLQRHPSTQGAW